MMRKDEEKLIYKRKHKKIKTKNMKIKIVKRRKN